MFKQKVGCGHMIKNDLPEMGFTEYLCKTNKDYRQGIYGVLKYERHRKRGTN